MMLSLISTLSLLVFVLFNGCSALPILPGQLSDSSITDEVTSGDTLNLRVNFLFFLLFNRMNSHCILVINQ